jgi:hypothetical protein
LLSPEQRAAFESYYNEKIVANSLTKADFTPLQTSVLDFNTFLSQVQEILSSDLRKIANDLNDSPILQTKRQNVEDIERQINQVDDDIESVGKEMSKAMFGTPSAIVNAEIAVKQEALIKKRTSLLKELQIETASIADIKADNQYQLELLKYEDQQKKEAFSVALNMYNTERSRMDQFAILEFQERSKQLAQQNQEAFQLKIKDIDQKFTLQREQSARDYEQANKK